MTDWRSKLPDEDKDKETKDLMDAVLKGTILEEAQRAHGEAYKTLEEVHRRLKGKASLGQTGTKITMTQGEGSLSIELAPDESSVIIKVDGQEVDKLWWYDDGKRLRNTKDNLRSVDQLIGNLATDKFKS